MSLTLKIFMMVKLPEITRSPLGQTATDQTSEKCPVNTHAEPESKSQSRTVLSREPEATMLPDGNTATQRTQ